MGRFGKEQASLCCVGPACVQLAGFWGHVGVWGSMVCPMVIAISFVWSQASPSLSRQLVVPLAVTGGEHELLACSEGKRFWRKGMVNLNRGVFPRF